jgi:beta-carotene hydroxylase
MLITAPKSLPWHGAWASLPEIRSPGAVELISSGSNFVVFDEELRVRILHASFARRCRSSHIELPEELGMVTCPPNALQLQVPAEKIEDLRALTQPPAVAWPTFCLWCVSMIGVLSSAVFALNGALPYWAASLLEIVFMYPLFGVIHDATHRSVSTNATLNDWIGRLSLLTIAPHGTLGMFRWAHMQHHRYTNGPKDPDRWVHGAWWSLPLRWMTFDLGYLLFIPVKGDAIGRRQLRITLFASALVLVVIAALVWVGFGLEVLVLWLIPARLTQMLFGFVFFWLPHVKDDVSAQENLTLASAMRFGHERWLGPLLQFHNYHLLHHLYPSTPPYNHPRVWQLLEPEIRRRDLAVQYGFDITPTVVPGRKTT